MCLASGKPVKNNKTEAETLIKLALTQLAAAES